jgi:DNA-directed RNA polymerase subunit M/transcription elongation factor TFIIS
VQLTAPKPRVRRERPKRRRETVLQARAQRSGGPEDRALYHCQCGYAFKAPVSTSVSCPHCGERQAW